MRVRPLGVGCGAQQELHRSRSIVNYISDFPNHKQSFTRVENFISKICKRCIACRFYLFHIIFYLFSFVPCCYLSLNIRCWYVTDFCLLVCNYALQVWPYATSTWIFWLFIFLNLKLRLFLLNSFWNTSHPMSTVFW